jgi:hypothetical protein
MTSATATASAEILAAFLIAAAVAVAAGEAVVAVVAGEAGAKAQSGSPVVAKAEGEARAAAREVARSSSAIGAEVWVTNRTCARLRFRERGRPRRACHHHRESARCWRT